VVNLIGIHSCNATLPSKDPVGLDDLPLHWELALVEGFDYSNSMFPLSLNSSHPECI